MGKTPDFKYNRNIVEIINDGRKPSTIPETGWFKVGTTQLDVDFENGWDNANALASTTMAANAAWYLNENGEVRIRGKVYHSSITEDTTIFTLPEEVRPETRQTFILPIDDEEYNQIDLSGIRFRGFQE